MKKKIAFIGLAFLCVVFALLIFEKNKNHELGSFSTAEMHNYDPASTLNDLYKKGKFVELSKEELNKVLKSKGNLWATISVGKILDSDHQWVNKNVMCFFARGKLELVFELEQEFIPDEMKIIDFSEYPVTQVLYIR